MYDDFHDCWNRGGDLDREVEKWEILASEMHQMRLEGCLNPVLVREVVNVTRNVKLEGLCLMSLAQSSEREIAQLAEQLEDMFVEPSNGEIAHISCHADRAVVGHVRKRAAPDDGSRRAKRSSRSISDTSLLKLDSAFSRSGADSDISPDVPPNHPISSHPLSSASASAPSPIKPTSAPNDALRLWFLQNLSNPYPTNSQKEALATASSVPHSKISSDLTNWRRRAGWTDIKDKWANGEKGKMRVLMEEFEAGNERREIVVHEIEKMKGYLERREDERVGAWIHEVSGSTLA